MAIYKEISAGHAGRQLPPDMAETLQSRCDEANRLFAKYIIKEYEGLIQNPKSAPTMSHTLMRDKVFPMLDHGERIFNPHRQLPLGSVARCAGDAERTLHLRRRYVYPLSYRQPHNMHAMRSSSGLFFASRDCENLPELWVDEESEEGKISTKSHDRKPPCQALPQALQPLPTARSTRPPLASDSSLSSTS